MTIRSSLRRVPVSTRAPGDAWWRLVAPKADSGRTIPLPAFVAEALVLRIAERDREQRAAKVYAPNDLVFCDPLGNSVPLESLRTWYRDALRRAGLPMLRWHDLRASCLTLLHEEGVDLFTIQAIAGHRDLDTTRRYVGRTKAPLDAAAKRLASALGGAG